MLLATLLLAAAVPARALRAAHSEARLIPEFIAAPGGQELRVGLWIKPDPGWHVYWRNPGDSGAAPILKWSSGTLEFGPIAWPFPRRLPVGPLMNFGYDGEVFLTQTARQAKAGARAATLKAEWLVCKEECVPAFGAFRLEVPAASQPRPHPEWARAFARTEPLLPRRPERWRLEASGQGSRLTLMAAPPHGAAVSRAEFFPYESPLIDHAAPQRAAADPGGLTLELTLAAQAPGVPARLAGVLVIDGASAYEIDAPVRAAAPGLLASLGLAFIGGLLLNLMPCVFPVLSIKVLGFLQSRESAKAHGLAYAAGVVASFWVLAGALLLLRSQGARLGWGFQLQSPVFLAGLAALFVALGLNLLGLFEVGAGLTRLGGLAAGGRGLTGSFLSGALAVVVATPCTAPFMGAALGAALALPTAAGLGIFTALALGMSAPYVALSFFPSLLDRLPRPGAWMETLKKALSVPLFATALWLLWVLGLQLGAERLKAASPLPWEPYSDARLESLLAEGREVFVDFTAAWCVTCQVNERVVLESAAGRRALSREGLALLKADWTSRDPAITEALERLGRSGVPVYALYAPGRPPALLPTILTPELLVNALKKDRMEAP